MKQKERNTNIEFLRFILMLFILIWHIIVHGYKLEEIGTHGFVYEGSMVLSLFLSTLTLPATYCFIFISGYFGLTLRLKRLAELYVWCLIISVAQTLVQKYYLGDSIGVRDLWQSLFPITTGRWWFISAYFKLLLLSPFLNYGMEKLDSKKQVLSISLIYSISLFRMVIGKPNAGSDLMGLVFMYLLGRYFRQKGLWSAFKTKCIYIFSFGCMFSVMLMIYYSSMIFGHLNIQKLIFYCMGFANPFVILMAISMFFYVVQLRKSQIGVLNQLFSPCLFIYLITEGMGGQIYKTLRQVIEFNFFVGGFCLFSLAFLCLLVGLLIQRLTKFLFSDKL